MKSPTLTLLATLGMTLCPGLIQAAAADYRVDQQHDWPNEFEAYHSIQGLAPVIQEFTPAIGALDVVEIWTQDLGNPQNNGLGATLQLFLRETDTGPVLAASAPLTLPDGWNAPSRFQFTNLVWLTPEVPRALELRVIAGDNWGVNSHGSLFPPAYSRGRYFLAGKPTEALDMWFRTGLRMPAPHCDQTGIHWQGVPPLNYLVWGSINLKDWGEIGQLTSTTANYSFTNLARAEPKLFFRVTHP